MGNYRDAVRRLAAAQKSGVNAPAYSRYINRPLGRHLAALASSLGLTPNNVTVISGMFSFTGVALIATVRPTLVTAALVTVALIIGYALDSADGQLARLRGGGSPLGEWLDHVIDSAKIPAVHLAVLISFYRFRPADQPWVLLLPVVFTFIAVVYFFAFILTDQLRRVYGDNRPSRSGGDSALRSLLLVPADFGLICVSFLLFATGKIYVIVYALLLLAAVIFLIAALRKWRGEMSRILPRQHSLEGASS